MLIYPNRLFPADPDTRKIARSLYEHVKDYPIISPHGHTQAAWFVDDQPFPDPAKLFVQPDHYVYRMLYSQGVSLDELEIGKEVIENPRAVWKKFAENYYLFRGTPTRMWLDWEFAELFGLEEPLSEKTADLYFDKISEKLATPEFRPRALYERFNIEVLATTDSPLDSLDGHKTLKESGWKGRVIPTFRPDSVVDADFVGFAQNIVKLGELTGEDTTKWDGYLNALRAARKRFKELGATATDHGHPTPQTADLSKADAAALFERVREGKGPKADEELFRAQMLTEFAGMSVEDGLVMQIHPGSVRNHNRLVYEQYGRDAGADIPQAVNYVHGLRPLLERYGNERELRIVLFTLDETTYSRELAPLAGHYPCLRLGPPWWFHDSPEGMMRFREQVTETAGFYNTTGFIDDTRAFLSIPSRHDVARRIDSAFLAKLVVEHRLREEDAYEVARDLTYTLAKKAFKL